MIQSSHPTKKIKKFPRLTAITYTCTMGCVFPKPEPNSVIYEDDKLYACLASQPLAKGHVIVAWKECIKDLHLLPKGDYEYLMDRVSDVRNALIEALGVEKVYLLYMDEAKHVHWHLVPRWNKEGFDMLCHEPAKTADFSLAKPIKEKLIITT